MAFKLKLNAQPGDLERAVAQMAAMPPEELTEMVRCATRRALGQRSTLVPTRNKDDLMEWARRFVLRYADDFNEPLRR